MAHINAPAPSELIRTSTFGIPVTTELNTRCIKVNGEIGAGAGDVANQWMTGSLVINATPALRLRRTGDAPYLQFENTTGASVLGTIQASTTLMIYNLTSATAGHEFRTANVERFRVDNTGATVTGTLTTTNVTSTVKGTFGGTTEQVRLVDTSTAGSDFHDVFIGFYGAGVSLVSPGVRTGLVGYAGSSTLYLRNEVLNGDAIVDVAGSGSIALTTTTGGVSINSTTAAITLNSTAGDINVTAGDAINFSSGGTLRGVIDNTVFLWGKTAAAIGTPGVEQYGGGVASGTIRSTVGETGSAIGTENIVLNRIATANVTGGVLIRFDRAGASTATITMRATAGVEFNEVVTHAPSDYRWKDDLGPVEGALDRVMRLRPRHVRWKGNGVEADEFMAHEVQAVFPELVKGQKDAVTPTGDVQGQSLNTAGLLPDVVAALQELAVRVEGLEAA